MKKQKKTLIDTNPYLKDPSQRKRLIEQSVTSSCEVEGIVLDLSENPWTGINRKKKYEI